MQSQMVTSVAAAILLGRGERGERGFVGLGSPGFNPNAIPSGHVLLLSVCRTERKRHGLMVGWRACLHLERVRHLWRGTSEGRLPLLCPFTDQLK